MATNFQDTVLISTGLRPSITGNYFGTTGTEFLGRKHALYSAGQSKTPVDSSGRSPQFCESFCG